MDRNMFYVIYFMLLLSTIYGAKICVEYQDVTFDHPNSVNFALPDDSDPSTSGESDEENRICLRAGDVTDTVRKSLRFIPVGNFEFVVPSDYVHSDPETRVLVHCRPLSGLSQVRRPFQENQELPDPECSDLHLDWNRLSTLCHITAQTGEDRASGEAEVRVRHLYMRLRQKTVDLDSRIGISGAKETRAVVLSGLESVSEAAKESVIRGIENNVTSFVDTKVRNFLLSFMKLAFGL